jgi:hypothetical protein
LHVRREGVLTKGGFDGLPLATPWGSSRRRGCGPRRKEQILPWILVGAIMWD